LAKGFEAVSPISFIQIGIFEAKTFQARVDLANGMDTGIPTRIRIGPVRLKVFPGAGVIRAVDLSFCRVSLVLHVAGHVDDRERTQYMANGCLRSRLQVQATSSRWHKPFAAISNPLILREGVINSSISAGFLMGSTIKHRQRC
jgi:hypothetical protein